MKNAKVYQTYFVFKITCSRPTNIRNSLLTLSSITDIINENGLNTLVNF
jgi:hypothetical protein